MANAGLSLRLECAFLSETISEFAALYGDGTGLPLHLIGEASSFLADCAKGRAVQEWFDVIVRRGHLEVHLTERGWALMANLRAARGVTLGHA